MIRVHKFKELNYTFLCIPALIAKLVWPCHTIFGRKTLGRPLKRKNVNEVIQMEFHLDASTAHIF